MSNLAVQPGTPAGTPTPAPAVPVPSQIPAPDPLLHANQTPNVPGQVGSDTSVAVTPPDWETQFKTLQREFTEKSQRLSVLEKTLDLVIPQGTTYAPPAPAAPITPQAKEDQEARNFVMGIVEEALAPIKLSAGRSQLFTDHPELNDPTFKKEIDSYVLSLPREVRMLEAFPAGASWLVNQYKALKKGAAPGTTPTPHMEGQVARPDINYSGPVYDREKIRELMRTNPAEAKRRNDELLAAYATDRVKGE